MSPSRIKRKNFKYLNGKEMVVNMRREEIIERMEETMEKWEEVVRRNEAEIRKFMREEESRELRALEAASNMWVKL